MTKHLSSAFLAAAALAIASGCAGKKDIKAQPLQAAATPTPVISKGSYIVKKGDSLWTISDKSGVLGDSFRWPLLFKANRDQIQDPDLIEPRQDLGFSKEYSKAEIEEAVAKAKETPPFVPHAAPRKSLPVKY